MEQDLARIEQFLDALWLERDLAENTLSAYRRDLSMVVAWLHHRGKTLATAQADDLQTLLAERVEGGYKATSSARLLSAMRRFFQHLYREKYREDDPSARWPRLSFRSVYRKILARCRLSGSCRRRLLINLWSCAIKLCWKCCMPPVCACRNWWG